ncbi:MAG: transketolase [Alphaproteobacteria bacterium]|nr:transketolase [Alphaproteobacteria bacterium]
MSQLSQLSKAVQFLSMDAVEKAQSGHPGMPMGMADIATVLWKKHLKFNPTNPHWFNRDRFILSNGHGSMLQYALLHLTGFALSLDEIKNFRQLHSKTPGHPECTDTPGVETTTGPLGQGLANAVGMAIAEKNLAAEFNQNGHQLVDHHTYAFVGDGCLMEGISHESCSLAGTLKLGKLIVLYDDNGISIDGEVKPWFSDDTANRFKAYHWQVIDGVDGHDFEQIDAALIQAKAETEKPTLIICKTTIGQHSEKEGTAKVHGAPLGTDDIQKIRQKLDWHHAPFDVPDDIKALWNHEQEGQQAEQDWLDVCASYQKTDAKKYTDFLRQINGDLPDDWQAFSKDFIQSCASDKQSIATRKASQQCIEHFAHKLPELFGGSADLTGSNNTNWSQTKAISEEDFRGNYIYYGVREFAMAAIMNGLALHGGFIPYGGTFLVFADYARNAMRLSALMKQRVIYVLTHDSIGLGEDGPTHQPVEHAAMLRLTPNMDVWRPADLTETAVAWQQAIEKVNGPSALLLSRQSLPALKLKAHQVDEIQNGGYILKESDKTPDVILIATGSEVEIAMDAANILEQEAIATRIVSMPCVERFLKMDKRYQERILPSTIKNRVAIEASSKDYWYRFTGLDGSIVGMDGFGVSAPAKDAYQYFNITVQATVDAAKKLIQK